MNPCEVAADKNKDAINADKRADIEVIKYEKLYEQEHSGKTIIGRGAIARKHGTPDVKMDIDVARGVSTLKRSTKICEYKKEIFESGNTEYVKE